MKTLMNKITKNLILPLAIIIGTSASTLMKNSTLEEFNIENKQVYRDFKKFIKEKGEPSGYFNTFLSLKKVYVYDYKTSDFNVFFNNLNKSLYLERKIKKENSYMWVSDKNVNGLKIKEKDECFKYKINGNELTDIKRFQNKDALNFGEEYTSLVSLELAKEYTNDLVKIMHDGKYPGY